MVLRDTDKAALWRDGIAKFPGVVPPDKVAAALRAINASLGSEGIDPEKLPTFRAQSYAPEVTRTSVITDLLTATPMWDIAQEAIGADMIEPVSSGQIALRFPSMDEPHDPHPHIDGMYTPLNGVKKGTIANFTALVGVFLSDVPQPYAGNFTVWPGTHRRYAEYFRERGPQSLLEGMPEVELPEPMQVTAKAGDAVLCHYQVGHGIAGNASPHTRYAIFFRLHRKGHDEIRWECMTDIWREWDGMRDVVEEAERAAAKA